MSHHQILLRVILLSMLSLLILSCKKEGYGRALFVYPDSVEDTINVHFLNEGYGPVDIQVPGTGIELTDNVGDFVRTMDVSGLRSGTYIIEIIENKEIVSSAYFNKK